MNHPSLLKDLIDLSLSFQEMANDMHSFARKDGISKASAYEASGRAAGFGRAAAMTEKLYVKHSLKLDR